MDNFKIILYSTIAFDLCIVIGVMFLIRHIMAFKRARQQKIIEQAKVNSTLEKANSTLQQTIDLKNQTIAMYKSKL